MNAKNIISVILMVLSFAACSSEIEGIDDNMTNTSANNGETSISVRMVTEGIGTKSESAENKPTTEEAAIKNYIIAVFEDKSGERVGYLKGSNTTTKSGVTGLIVGGIDCKAGIVNVIVIANLSKEEENIFDTVYTYEEFRKREVHSLSNLVKVGENSKEISPNEDNNSITVKLSQLTARVKVSFGGITINGDKTGVTATFVPQSFQAKQQMSSTLFDPVAGNGELTSPVSFTGDTKDFSFYTYKLSSPEVLVSTNILVSKKVSETETKESVIQKKDVSVSFTHGGETLSVLENGKAYSLEINAIITISVQEDVPCNVTFSYTVHEIENIEQDIEFN